MESEIQSYSIDISIVIPVYYNSDSLKPLFKRIKDNVIDSNTDKSFEVIFIDDGSKDSSFDVLRSLKQNFPNYIKLVKFTRNFGQGPAITAGFRLAQGNFIINMDADLQDPPELINDMIKAHYTEEYDIVIGIRGERKESLYRRTGSNIWYRTLKKLTFPEFPENGFNFYGISKKVNKTALENVNNGSHFTNILIVWTGYPMKHLPYKREEREHGKSRFGFFKKITTIFDTLISFSFFPIRMMTVLGITISFLGFIYAGLIILAKLFGEESLVPFKGWAPIMILILVLSGFQMLMIGIIGEYVWRTLDTTRKRDMYVIDKIY